MGCDEGIRGAAFLARGAACWATQCRGGIDPRQRCVSPGGRRPVDNEHGGVVMESSAVIGEHGLSQEANDEAERDLIGEMPSGQVLQAVHTEVAVGVAAALDDAVRVEQDTVTRFHRDDRPLRYRQIRSPTAEPGGIPVVVSPCRGGSAVAVGGRR